MHTKGYQIANLIVLIVIGITVAIASYAYNSDIKGLKVSDQKINEKIDIEIEDRKESDKELKSDLLKDIDGKADQSAFDILMTSMNRVEMKLDKVIEKQ